MCFYLIIVIYFKFNVINIVKIVIRRYQHTLVMYNF